MVKNSWRLSKTVEDGWKTVEKDSWKQLKAVNNNQTWFRTVEEYQKQLKTIEDGQKQLKTKTIEDGQK